MQVQVAGRALAAIGMLLIASSASAQNVPDSDIQRRLAELEQQVANLRRPAQPRLTSTYYGEDAQPESAPDPLAASGCVLPECRRPTALVGQDFLNTGCRQCGIVFGSELIFLKPVATNGDLPGATANVTTSLGLFPPRRS